MSNRKQKDKIKHKLSQLQFELSCLELSKEDLTGVNIRTEELKELIDEIE